jgi:hypothetical protein
LRDCAKLSGERGDSCQWRQRLANSLRLLLPGLRARSIGECLGTAHGLLFDQVSSLLRAELAGKDLLGHALQRSADHADSAASCTGSERSASFQRAYRLRTYARLFRGRLPGLNCRLVVLPRHSLKLARLDEIGAFDTKDASIRGCDSIDRHHSTPSTRKPLVAG